MAKASPFEMSVARLPTAAILLVFFLLGQVRAQGVWTIRAPMPTPRTGLAAVTIGELLYAVGGVRPGAMLGTLEAYDSRTNAWTTKASMPTPRGFLGAAAIGGVLYAVGGLGDSATLEAYDPSTNQWLTRTSMPTGRSGLAVAVANGVLYAIGGSNNTGPLGTVEAYDPKTDTWMTKMSMSTPRVYLAAVAVNGIVYAIGGDNGRDGPLSKVEAYDPATNTWSTRAPLALCRRGLAATVSDGLLYAIGGQTVVRGPGGACGTNNGGELETVERYAPQANSWTSGAPMLTAREQLGVSVIDETIYALGGHASALADPILAINEAFSPFLAVSIDIKPGDPNNTINLKSNADVTVAILGSATLGAANIDPASATLAEASVASKGNGALKYSLSDVNRDGFIDLLVDFRARELQLAATDTEAVLKATTFAGQRIRGVDAVRIVK